MGQLRAFIRKSLIVKRRSPCQLVCEIVPTIILFGIAVIIAASVKPTTFYENSTPFDSAIPIVNGCMLLKVANAQPIYLFSADALVQANLPILATTMTTQSNCSLPVVVSTSSAQDNFDAKQDGWSAGIDVTKLDLSTGAFEYTIRMTNGVPKIGTENQVPNTRTVIGRNGDDAFKLSLAYVLGPSSNAFRLCNGTDACKLFPYANSGFIGLQILTDMSFRKMMGINVLPSFIPFLRNLFVTDFPHPTLERPIDYSLIATYLGFSYIASTFVLAKQMLSEKEKKIKEGMQIMSLKTWVFWLGWFITGLISVAPISVLMILLGIGVVFRHSSPGLVILTVIFFGLSLIALTFLVYTIFKKPRTGGTFLLILQTIGIIVYSVLQQQDVSEGVLQFISLLSPLAFLRAATLMASGIKDARQSKYSIGSSIGMLILDTIIYLALAWYLDKVIPGEYGQNLPWYFPFSPSYWSSRRRRANQSEVALGTTSETMRDRIQDLPPDVEVSVKIANLRKLFQMNPLRPSEKDKLAVSDLSFAMVRGQVFSLLGHNGAGKTTTISMLTGMLPMTSGNIVVEGLSVNSNLAEIRRSMGLCPQHDVLYDELTVEEHLRLYGEIKGLIQADLEREINELISAVDLEQKRFNNVSQLSGGMKRKLSLAIAYIGNPKLVVLDEPTAGMDPLSRRKMWDLINRMKPGRTTLLTTHFLDEADILGDRIGIMANGVMKCLGTSLFLKNRFGLGYTLGIVKDSTYANSEMVRQFVHQHVPAAEESTCTGGEQGFRLPVVSTPSFPPLLSGLRQIPGVVSFGLSITTLEEVFLKIADESDEFSHQIKPGLLKKGGEEVARAEWQTQPQITPRDIVSAEAGMVRTEEFSPTFSSQAHAMILKKWWQTKRSLMAFVFNLGLPIVLLLIGGAVSTLIATNASQGPVALTAAAIFAVPSTNVMYSVNISNPQLALTTDPFFNTSSSPSNPLSTFTNVPFVAPGFPNLTQTLLNIWVASDNGILNYPGALTFGGGSVNNTSPPDPLMLWHNRRVTHALPVFANIIGAAASGNSSAAKIVTTTQPLTWKTATASTNLIVFVSFFVFAYCFPPGYFGVSIVSERVNKTRHSMRLMGMKLSAYWSVTAVFDFVYMTIPTLFAILSIGIFGVSPLSKQCFGVVVLVLFLYQIAIIPFVYLLARVVSAPENFQLSSILISILLGLIGTIAYYILDLIGTLQDSDSLKQASTAIFYILNFIPIFNVSASIYRIGSAPVSGISWTDPTASRVLQSDTKVTHCIAYQVANFFIYSAILAILESNRFRRLVGDRGVEGPPVQEPHDNDVVVEKERMQRSGTSDMISMKGLRKVYAAAGPVPEKVAVNSMYLGIPVGQVFGLLGANGAGKTTTMKMLTGDILPSGGEATVDGHDIQTNIDDAYKVMGYCPQFDALFNDLTGREHLRLFSMIKGVSNESALRLTEDMLTRMSLTPYADKLAGTYSGGNKRKLSVTVALMANPKVVYLDEPSTGMDPASRRFMWDVISSAMSSRAVILTTHSMEEADALCSRIGIVVNGDLKCVGSAQHLKNKFGSGLQIQLHTDVGNEEVVIGFVKSMFPQCNVVESFAGNIAIEAEAPNVDLGPVFQHFETYKAQYKILDYSISQTTLEQVFLRFARGQIQDARD